MAAVDGFVRSGGGLTISYCLGKLPARESVRLINDTRSHIIGPPSNELEGPFPTAMYSIRFLVTITPSVRAPHKP